MGFPVWEKWEICLLDYKIPVVEEVFKNSFHTNRQKMPLDFFFQHMAFQRKVNTDWISLLVQEGML